MSEKEIIEGAADAVSKHLPKTTKSIDDVVSSIVGIFDTVLFPFQALNAFKKIKMEEFQNNLEKKVSKIPESQLKKELDLNIVGPTLEALKYTFLEDDLREMFENLLASSIDKREDVFPGFVDIIRQLSPDEAKLIKYLSSNGRDYPLIDLHYTLEKNNSYFEILLNFSDIGFGLLDKPELLPAYLNSLMRFGLIDIKDGVFLTDNSLYTSIENHPIVQKAKSVTQSEKGKYETKKKKFTITDYGASFIQSCVIKK